MNFSLDLMMVLLRYIIITSRSAKAVSLKANTGKRYHRHVRQFFFFFFNSQTSSTIELLFSVVFFLGILFPHPYLCFQDACPWALRAWVQI